MVCCECSKPLEGELAPHLCSACGMPQGTDSPLNVFETFGLQVAFGIDLAQLQKRFYALSRALHPDRFVTASAVVKARSLERMTQINEAYQVLKDDSKRRDAVLVLVRPVLEGKGAKKAAVVPEFAERWFGIQELLMEEPDIAQVEVKDFSEALTTHKTRILAECTRLQMAFDKLAGSPVNQQGIQGIIDELLLARDELNYIFSMEREVEKVLCRFNSLKS